MKYAQDFLMGEMMGELMPLTPGSDRTVSELLDQLNALNSLPRS